MGRETWTYLSLCDDAHACEEGSRGIHGEDARTCGDSWLLSQERTGEERREEKRSERWATEGKVRYKNLRKARVSEKRLYFNDIYNTSLHFSILYRITEIYPYPYFFCLFVTLYLSSFLLLAYPMVVSG